MTLRISTEGYQVFREALANVTWYRDHFEKLLRKMFRDCPELLVELDFKQQKRIVADLLVDRLMAVETKYQDVTLAAMIDIADMTTFPDIERLKEPDRSVRFTLAKDSVGKLRVITGKHTEHIDSLASSREAIAASVKRASTVRRFADELGIIRDWFTRLKAEKDAQFRGREFEVLLNSLFALFDLEPHMAYSIELEQIDGSFTFDTDDYVPSKHDGAPRLAAVLMGTSSWPK